MAVHIQLNESTASYRVVPLFCLRSDGTSAATNETGGTFTFDIGGVNYGSGGSLSVVSANAGQYAAVFNASKLSLLGPGSVQYSSGTALATSAAFQVVAYKPMVHLLDEPLSGHTVINSLGLHNQVVSSKTLKGGTTISDLTLSSNETSNATVLRGAFINIQLPSGDWVGRFLSQVTCSTNVDATLDYPLPVIAGSGCTYILFPQTANVWSQLTGTSNATILGVTNLDSAVSLKAVTHSGATIQGLSNYANISNVTLAAGTHSGATIQGVTRVNSNVTPANGLYSAVTVRIDNVSYSGVTISGLLNASAVDYPSVATAVWGFTSGRTVQIAAGDYSDVTIQGVKRLNSSVTPANAVYSGVTVRIDQQSYSGVTISGILGTVTATVDYPSVATAVWGFTSGRTVQIGAGDYSDVTIQGVKRLNSGVTLNANTHSGATIDGVNRVNSSVTPANGLYSAVTVRIDPQNYSGLTVQGVTRVNSSVTPADGLYSAVTVRIDPQAYSGLTVQGLSNYANISNVTLAAGTHSGVTIDGVKFLSTAGERSIASSHLSSDLGNGRLVQQAHFMNRNKVEGVIPGSSILTVYQTDDATSSWTATPSFNTFGGLAGFDPR